MGLFSFMDCVAGEGNIKIGQECCILVPNEFRYIYGRDGMIYDSSYDGYGHFCDVDVFEFLAIVNRKYLSVDMIPDDYYPSIMSRENLEKLIPAFVAGTRENDLDEDFGDEWLRTLGIILANDCHEKLHYPLKVTHLCYGEVSYEDINGYSEDDPNQGY